MRRLIAFKDKQVIKVVTGIRRCGKSTLLEMYQDWLRKQGVQEEQIIAINFEDMDYEDLTDRKALYQYLKSRLVSGKMTYIFLDEVHHVQDFPKVVDSLYIKKKYRFVYYRLERLHAVERDRYPACRTVCPDRNASPFFQRILDGRRKTSRERDSLYGVSGNAASSKASKITKVFPRRNPEINSFCRSPSSPTA